MLLALAGFSLALAAAIAYGGLSLTTDRYLLVLLVPALVIRRARRYLLDFVPFAALLLTYQECRGLAHALRPHPYYLPQLDADKFLFGGHVPTVALQNWLWSGHLHLFDKVIVDITDVHFIVPPALAFVLWAKRRALFYRFAATLLTLSFAGALTFLLYPAAPPWAAARHGLLRAPFALLARQVSGLEPVRRGPVAPRRLRVPRLSVRGDARVEDPLALVGDRNRDPLSARSVVCRHLYGEPLRR